MADFKKQQPPQRAADRDTLEKPALDHPALPDETPHAPAGEGAPEAPLLDLAGPVPRVVDQKFRIPVESRKDFTRYKIRANVPGEVADTHYILVRKGDVQAAQKLYLDATRQRRTRQIYDTDPSSKTFNTIKTVELPHELVTTELPD